MIHYRCDLCGEQCDDKVFIIPIAATYNEHTLHDLMPVEVNLCNKCRTEIYNTIKKR